MKLIHNQTEAELAQFLQGRIARIHRLRGHITDAVLLGYISAGQRSAIYSMTPDEAKRVKGLPAKYKRAIVEYAQLTWDHWTSDRTPKLTLVHTQAPSAVDILRARVKRGVDMAKVKGKGEYYTHRRV